MWGKFIKESSGLKKTSNTVHIPVILQIHLHENIYKREKKFKV